MIINIKKNKILNELIKVSKIINKKTLISSLLGILVKVKKEKVIFIASDGNISIKSEILSGNELTIKSTGNFLIKSKFIIEIIRKIECNFITLETIKNKCNLIKIKTDNFESVLNTLNVIDYPNILFDIKGKEIILNSFLLKEIIKQTSFAIGEKEIRTVFNGLNIKTDKKNKQLIITATDSFRLAYKKNVYYNKDYDFDIIIPKKFINFINKLISEKNQEIKIKITDKLVNIILNENTIIQTNTIEGKYPDTSKVISKLFNTLLIVNNHELIKIIERASIFSNETMTTIITLKIKNQKIFITSFVKEIGNTEEEIKEFKIKGSNQIITFNSKYILEALKSFKTKEVIIKIIDETKPLIITSSENDSLQQLILPIRSY